MSFNLKLDLTAQEIICWIGLFALAVNPHGAFSGMIEAVGYKLPLLTLATGAGLRTIKDHFKGGSTNA
jgi:hypothetical protein